MCKLEQDEVTFFRNCGFKIIKKRNHYVEVKTDSGQYYCIYKEDTDIVILLHRHHANEKYHIHYVFDQSSKAVSEILQHEKYLKKRDKERKKICKGRKISLTF